MKAFLTAARLFLGGIPSAIYLPILGGIALALGIAWHSHEKSAAYDAAYAQGAADTKEEFVAAQDEADRLATVGVKIITGKQAAISGESSHALDQTTHAIAARADAIRVRHDAQAAVHSAPGRVDLPGASQAASEPCPAPSEDGLPWSVAYPLMLQAQLNLAQLNAVLDEVEKQDALTEQEAALASPATK